jgi:hypothetical protein
MTRKIDGACLPCATKAFQKPHNNTNDGRLKMHTHKTNYSLVLTAILMFSVVSVTLPRRAYAQVGPQAIKGCTKITQPGSYLVVNNITATYASLIPTSWGEPGCLVIAADFVTLDLGGFTIFGPAKYGAGVIAEKSVATTGLANAYRGITVHSGVVTNFTIGVGLQSLFTAGGYVVEHVRAIGNGGDGINVFSVGSRIVGNVATDNGGNGVYILCPSVVLENGAYGNRYGDIVEAGAGCTRAENSPAP